MVLRSVHVRELAGLVPDRRDGLLVRGSGAVVDQRFADWDLDSLFLEDPRTPLEVLPWPLSWPFRARQSFHGCTFSGIRIHEFQPGSARFVDCRFEGVALRSSLPVQCHFVRCTFDGDWDGNVWRETLASDSRRSTEVVDNDWRRLTGIGFLGGVPVDGNRFDLDGDQRILLVDGPGWDRVKAVADRDPYLTILVSSLEGRGPMWMGQDWTLVDRRVHGERIWQLVVEALPAGS